MCYTSSTTVGQIGFYIASVRRATEMGSCLGYQSEGTVVEASVQQQRDPLYDYLPLLPKELQGLILGYVRVAFTNASLRATVTEYFEDRAACERRHGKIGTWDVSRVTRMSELFFRVRVDASEFNEDIGAWDTSSVTTMWRTFAGCDNFEGRGIGAWDTSSVRDMSYMFAGCRAFNENIGAWDTSKVGNMMQMFDSAHAFNQDISSWNVSSVTNMSWMFIHCRSFNQSLRSWDTSSVRSVPPTNWTGADYFLADEWHNAIRPPVRVADHETPYHRGLGRRAT